MKRRVHFTILFVLVMASVVYLLVTLPHRGFLHALAEKTSTNQESEQNPMSPELTVVEGQTFKQGETVKLAGKIKNVSDKTMLIREPVEDWTLRVYIEFKPELGFQEMQPNGFISMAGPSLITLKPSEESPFTVVFTPTLYSLPGVGEYRVYMKYGHAPEKDRSVWAGDVKSPIATISIVEK